MELHCVRLFLMCEKQAQLNGLEADRELMLCAAFLHDAGVYPSVSTGDVYVTDGRRLAERTLAPFGWAPERLAVCLDGIEQHHSRQSRWDWGTEVELIRRADLAEVTRGLVRYGMPREWLRDLFARVPRKGFWRLLGPLVWRMLRERPRTMLRIGNPRSEPTRASDSAPSEG